MTDQTAATECAFADEGCTCGRPRLTLTEAQARMAATPKPGPTFATYLDRHDRDQLDARAATAEQERDEALDARDVLRQQLDQARAELATEHRERTESEAWGRQLRTELTKAQNERNTALRTIAAIRDAASPPSSVPPRRAQEDPTAEALAEHLTAHQWYSKPEFPLLHEPSAHREHIYNSDCAICRGDWVRVAGVALAFVLDEREG